MNQKQKYILIFILTLIGGINTFFQYNGFVERHQRLSFNGIRTKITATSFNEFGVECVKYHFITLNGQKIEKSQKSQGNFKEFVDAAVIYNPKLPTEFDLESEFENYSKTWSVIFMFFIYLPISVFVIFKLINGCVKIYYYLRN